MNRDDVLRELELLPAWKLRAPVEAKQVQQVAVEKLEAAQVVIVALEESAREKPPIENPSSVAEIQYEITMSEDKRWAFVCESNIDRMDIDSQGTLFKNILHALSIEKYSKMQLTNVADIQASMVVAMGESVAQALLKTQESVENLRGRLHPFGHTQLLATCDLAQLLNNPLDKAKVWQDLCLASSYLHGLQVQD
jgi:DNA polymerase III psi subunit